MTSSSSSYTSSSGYTSSSSDDSSSHRRSRRSTHATHASHDSDWTVSYAKLGKRQPMGIRFMGYVAGRPARATAMLKKVRDAPDNRSVLSVSSAGSIFAYEPETRMYWVKEHGGGGGGGGVTATFVMPGAAATFVMPGAMPGPCIPPVPSPMAQPVPPPPMPRPPPNLPTVRVAGPPRNSPPAPTIPGFDMPVAIDMRRAPFMG